MDKVPKSSRPTDQHAVAVKQEPIAGWLLPLPDSRDSLGRSTVIEASVIPAHNSGVKISDTGVSAMTDRVRPRGMKLTGWGM